MNSKSSLLVLLTVFAVAQAQNLYYAQNSIIMGVCVARTGLMDCKFASYNPMSTTTTISMNLATTFSRTAGNTKYVEFLSIPITATDRTNMATNGITLTIGSSTASFSSALWISAIEGGSSADYTLAAVSSTKQAYYLYPPGTQVFLKVRASSGCQGPITTTCTNSPCSLTSLTTGRDYFVDIATSSVQYTTALGGGYLMASSQNYPNFMANSCSQPTGSPSSSDSGSWWTTGNIIWVTIVCVVVFIALVVTVSTISGIMKRRRMRGLNACCCGTSSFSFRRPVYSYSSSPTPAYIPPSNVEPAYVPPTVYVPPTQPTYTPAPNYAPQPYIPPTAQPIAFSSGDNVMLDPVTGLFIVQPSAMEQPPPMNPNQQPQFDPVTGEFRMM